MKKPYVSPTVEMVVFRIERGFAASKEYGLQQFQYDGGEGNQGDADNTAW